MHLSLFVEKSEFHVGLIGEMDYPEEQFDVITSMDTMYFAKDMNVFVAQIKRWLKHNGVFFVVYQEGEVMSKTENIHTTVLAKALEMNELFYEAVDITEKRINCLRKSEIRR